jgi:hypothetical protein
LGGAISKATRVARTSADRYIDNVSLAFPDIFPEEVRRISERAAARAMRASGA